MTDQSVIEKAMATAIERARETMSQDFGGPFGAAIIDPSGEIVAIASNTVLRDGDATAHAEINAIRQASRKRGTHDLTGHTIVTTGYPCPMCLGAIIWSNIKDVYYGCRPKDAEAIGFRDEFIYEYIRNPELNEDVLRTSESDRDSCLALFEEYVKKGKTIY
ncbi:MAG: nucleoside deaminase [Acholeplasmataceae bacterium]